MVSAYNVMAAGSDRKVGGAPIAEGFAESFGGGSNTKNAQTKKKCNSALANERALFNLASITLDSPYVSSTAGKPRPTEERQKRAAHVHIHHESHGNSCNCFCMSIFNMMGHLNPQLQVTSMLVSSKLVSAYNASLVRGCGKEGSVIDELAWWRGRA